MGVSWLSMSITNKVELVVFWRVFLFGIKSPWLLKTLAPSYLLCPWLNKYKRLSIVVGLLKDSGLLGVYSKTLVCCGFSKRPWLVVGLYHSTSLLGTIPGRFSSEKSLMTLSLCSRQDQVKLSRRQCCPCVPKWPRALSTGLYFRNLMFSWCHSVPIWYADL